MAEYLCKTTIRTCLGGIRYEYGLIYPAEGRLGNGRSIGETVESGDSCDGSHNAFELVVPNWPHPKALGNVEICNHNGIMGVDLAGCVFVHCHARTIRDWLDKWLAVADGEVTK